MGVTVFTGMIGVTLFGLLLTPVFYVALRKLANHSKNSKSGADDLLPLEQANPG
jgi:multidrug efflux pump